MKYLFLGLMITLMSTTFMFAFGKSAAFVGLRERAAKGKSGRRG